MKKYLPIVLLSIVFILLLLFLKPSNTLELTKEQNIAITNTSTPTEFHLTNISNSDTIVSPQQLLGKVKSNWMFEGTFSVELLDQNRQSIANSACFETVPGSWTSEGMIDFSCDLKFKTLSSSGYLVFNADNPSGLPQNDKSFEIPVIIGQDTSNWKTYKSDSLGFSFSYPSNYMLQTDIQNDPEVELRTDCISITFRETKSDKTLEKYLISQSFGLHNEKNIQQKIENDNIRQIKIGNKETIGIGPLGMSEIANYFVKKNDSIIFEVIVNSFCKQESNSVDQILRSVKFLPQSPTTINTTKYSCPAGEWIDCMPGPGPVKPQCQPEYLQWAQSNCPNFQGAAL